MLTKLKSYTSGTKAQKLQKYEFRYGRETVDVINSCKYSGLIHLNLNMTGTVLAESTGGALGSIQNKFY